MIVFLLVITIMSNGEEVSHISYMPNFEVCNSALKELTKNKTRAKCIQRTTNKPKVVPHPWSR